MEIIHTCSNCGWPERIEDEGQHRTIAICIKCGRNEVLYHRPDPDPLPPERERLRFETIKKLLTDFTFATVLLSGRYRDQEWLTHVHNSAQETANFLFGYQARKTIMTGGRKK